MLDLVCDYAPICVTRDYAPALELSGIFEVVDREGRKVMPSDATVLRLGVRIEFITGDNFFHIAPEKLRRTCAEDACVAFRMSCNDLTCSWQVGPMPNQGETQLAEVRLTASSPGAMDRAKANVFVSFASVGGRQRISLAQLGEGQPAAPGLYEGFYIKGDQRLPTDAPQGR